MKKGNGAPHSPSRAPDGEEGKGVKRVSKRELSYDDLFNKGIVHAVYRGANLIPIAPLEKKPLVKWEKYQKETYPGPFPAQCNLAVICGGVSQNLFVFDFDDPQKVPEKWKAIDTLVVRTPRGGFHYYFKCEKPVGTSPAVIQGVDIKGEGGYVLIPPSRVRKDDGSVGEYTFVKNPGYVRLLFTEDLVALLKTLDPALEVTEQKGVLRVSRGIVEKPEARQPAQQQQQRQPRALREEEVLKIVSMLKPAYVPGNRDLIVFYLTGWLRKAGVDYDSARRIVEALAEGDEEFNSRVYVLERTYGLRGSPPSGEEMKGKSGLQEVIEEALQDREKALEVIRQLEEAIGAPSPWRDAIFSRYVFKGGGVVNDRKNNVIVKAELAQDGRLVYTRIIAETAIHTVTIFENPLSGEVKYDVKYTGLTGAPKSTGPVNLNILVEILQSEALVKSHRDMKDALSAIITRMVQAGMAEVRQEIEAPGFYLIRGELKSVLWDGGDANPQALREALELLRELREVWYAHLGARFTTVVKWGLVAPFGYAMKQKKGGGVHIPWLLVYGESLTGKTTLGYIIRHMWGLPPLAKTGSSMDTVARLGAVLSETTFPVVVNEVADPLNKEDILEMVKAGVEGTVARARVEGGIYRKIPSLAPLFMTCNYLPYRVADDPGAFRRLLVIRFSYYDRLQEEKIRQFEAEVKPRLEKLAGLGAFAYKLLRENVELLQQPWESIAETILEKAVEYAGLEKRGWEWVREAEKGESHEEYREEVIEILRVRLLDDINERYTRHVTRVAGVNATVRERLEALLHDNLIPYIVVKDEETLVLTTALKRELNLGLDLKTLAERLGEGFEYKLAKVGEKVVRGIVASKEAFLRFLEPTP